MVAELVFSTSMAVQDQCGGNTVLAGTGMSLNVVLQNANDSQLKEQFSCGNDYSPKVRKPYTITKQRERWTEEEHKKFLEALKLYGRAWRRIEEHVGTKTAVQIRSHAQKFFSKVVREGSSSNTAAAEPVDIPPPRPKRKPMHPYPRKLAHPLNKDLVIPEQPLRSSSSNFSISEQENQSPTSVLSAIGSDILGSAISDTPNRSTSPVSCAGGSHHVDFTVCDPNSTSEDNGTPSPVTPTAQAPKVQKFELFSKEDMFPEEILVETTSTRSLKLFGRTVLVTECHRPSSPCKLDTVDQKLAQPLWNSMSTASQHSNVESNWSHLPQGPPEALYYLQIQKENSSPAEAGSVTTLPWWAFYGNVQFPFAPFHAQEVPSKEQLNSNGEENQDKENQKEGSWTGSNSGLVNDRENTDKNTDGETESVQVSSKVKQPCPVLERKHNAETAASGSCMKGFVPYKKRRAERDGQSSTITGDEEEEQRVQLSL